MIEKKKYKCLKCQFQFRLATDRNLLCPNCSSDSSMIEEIKEGDDAQVLINNSETWQ